MASLCSTPKTAIRSTFLTAGRISISNESPHFSVDPASSAHVHAGALRQVRLGGRLRPILNFLQGNYGGRSHPRVIGVMNRSSFQQRTISSLLALASLMSW